MGGKRAKRERAQMEADEVADDASSSSSSEHEMGRDMKARKAPKKKARTDDARTAVAKANDVVYKNKQRVLIFSSRGITHRFRHLLNDLRVLMPHSKTDVKLDSKGTFVLDRGFLDTRCAVQPACLRAATHPFPPSFCALDKLHVINEVCEMRSCNNCIFFEVRKHEHLFLWLAKTPSGPSVKFHVSNVHTMDELKMTGNCLKGSRPVLSFDSTFDSTAAYRLMKEVMTQTFASPKGHRNTKPFVDHVLSFHIADNKIWARNYQIVRQHKDRSQPPTSLVEIGPRFVLTPIRIFEGSFSGATLY